MRRIHEGSFNVITQWDYRKICELVGGGASVLANTKGELDEAIRRAQDSGELTVIEVRFPATTSAPSSRGSAWKWPNYAVGRCQRDPQATAAVRSFHARKWRGGCVSHRNPNRRDHRQRADLNPRDHSCK